MNMTRSHSTDNGSNTSQMEAANYFDEPNAPTERPKATLERLADLANEARTLEAEIAAATTALEEKRADYDRIVRAHIPEIMGELGMEEFKLVDGSKVTVKQDIKCGLTEERKPAGFAWLRDTQNDGIIKTQVSLAFGKGEAKDAEKAVEALHAAGFDNAATEDSVHPATLKSFVKECLENGVSIPLDTFGVYEFKLAKITAPKTRR